MTPFDLTPEEKRSPLWRKLKMRMEMDVAELQLTLESTEITKKRANVLRGEIRRIRFLLSLGDTQATASEADYD